MSTRSEVRPGAGGPRRTRGRRGRAGAPGPRRARPRCGPAGAGRRPGAAPGGSRPARSRPAPRWSSAPGWARATSACWRIDATGERSSCDASETNRRWRAWACSRRASMRFMVVARREISSSPAPVGHPAVQLGRRDLVDLGPDRLHRRQRPPRPAATWCRRPQHQEREPDRQQPVTVCVESATDVDGPATTTVSRPSGGRPRATARNRSSSIGAAIRRTARAQARPARAGRSRWGSPPRPSRRRRRPARACRRSSSMARRRRRPRLEPVDDVRGRSRPRPARLGEVLPGRPPPGRRRRRPWPDADDRRGQGRADPDGGQPRFAQAAPAPAAPCLASHRASSR